MKTPSCLFFQALCAFASHMKWLNLNELKINKYIFCHFVCPAWDRQNFDSDQFPQDCARASRPKFGGAEEAEGIWQKVEAGPCWPNEGFVYANLKSRTDIRLLHQIAAVLIKPNISAEPKLKYAWLNSWACVISCVETELNADYPVDFF